MKITPCGKICHVITLLEQTIKNKNVSSFRFDAEPWSEQDIGIKTCMYLYCPFSNLGVYSLNTNKNNVHIMRFFIALLT